MNRNLKHKIFKIVADEAANQHIEAYVIGGFVRDIFLKRPSKDIDIVAVGSGIALAEGVARNIGQNVRVNVFKNFGTAQFVFQGLDIEFVGARKESYNRDSRNPIVEEGTLDDDQKRRDFTINAMAFSLNKDNFGDLVDPFGGIEDLKNRRIVTPLDPDITFSDDPLRMMRAIRFASQLNFDIDPVTFEAIKRNAKRIEIITAERILEELNKIILSPKPSRGFILLYESGILDLIFPEFVALKGIETVNGKAHKDNFFHTLEVLDNLCKTTDNIWLRWSAIFHDIGKPVTKKYDPQLGWTFHNHNFVGVKMLPRIFRRMKFPMNEKMKYIEKMVDLHMRPIVLTEEEITDSAIRRLLFEAGDDIDDLMLLCNADITSKNPAKVKRFLENFEIVRQKLVEIENKDNVRNFQPPVTGEMIMETFNLRPSQPVGIIKQVIKDAILDGDIANNYEQAYALMLQTGIKMGLTPKD